MAGFLRSIAWQLACTPRRESCCHAGGRCDALYAAPRRHDLSTVRNQRAILLRIMKPIFVSFDVQSTSRGGAVPDGFESGRSTPAIPAHSRQGRTQLQSGLRSDVGNRSLCSKGFWSATYQVNESPEAPCRLLLGSAALRAVDSVREAIDVDRCRLENVSRLVFPCEREAPAYSVACGRSSSGDFIPTRLAATARWAFVRKWKLNKCRVASSTRWRRGDGPLRSP